LDTLTMTLACRNPVKEKSPVASVVVDVSASGPLTIDTVAAGIGTNVRLVTTFPLSEKVLGVGAAGEDAGVALPPQPTAVTKNTSAHSRFSM
jgi:hypothetical protein